jgi:hypothetical protein
MLGGLFNQIAILFGCVLTAFIFGYFKGKNDQKIKQLKANVKDVIQTKKRRRRRGSDDISTIRRRMCRYII